MAVKKKKSIHQLTDQAAMALQKLVRVKAANGSGLCECVTCGAVKHWKEMQGGHFIPRGNAATKLLEENVHPQCAACNGFGMKYGDAAQRYTLYMQDMYGRDVVNEMLSTKRKSHQWNRVEVEELIVEFNQQVEHIMKDKGLS